MSAQDSFQAYKDLLAANPHTGTADQVVALSIGIADAYETLERSAFTALRDESGLNSKVFSKLKVIGESLKAVDERKRADVIKGLPASYSTIHLLCSLKPEELVTAVKSGAVKPKMSVRAAEAYVKQVRFPHLAVTGALSGERKRNDVQVFGIHRLESMPMDEGTLQRLEEELKGVCDAYGVLIRKTVSNTTTSLKQEDRARKEIVWRGLLEKEQPLEWFQKVPDELKKQFNLKTHEELLNTPLRSFTGFLVKTEGSRDAFWEKHGRAYVAKLHLEYEKTDDRAQRHNLKRRIDEVLATPERIELARWRNIIAKETGVMY